MTDDQKRVGEIEVRWQDKKSRHEYWTPDDFEDIQFLISRIKSLEEENVNLRKFAREVMEGWPDAALLDEFGMQDLALECGLLEKVKMDKPCGENCWCDGYYGEKDWPVTCYQRRGALAEGKGS